MLVTFDIAHKHTHTVYIRNNKYGCICFFTTHNGPTHQRKHKTKPTICLRIKRNSWKKKYCLSLSPWRCLCWISQKRTTLRTVCICNATTYFFRRWWFWNQIFYVCRNIYCHVINNSTDLKNVNAIIEVLVDNGIYEQSTYPFQLQYNVNIG